MKKISILLIPAALLSACQTKSMEAVNRSDVVKVCNDGTWVGFDPKTKRYTVANEEWVGTVAEGVELESICQEKK